MKQMLRLFGLVAASPVPMALAHQDPSDADHIHLNDLFTASAPLLLIAALVLVWGAPQVVRRRANIRKDDHS